MDLGKKLDPYMHVGSLRIDLSQFWYDKVPHEFWGARFSIWDRLENSLWDVKFKIQDYLHG